jgi:PilZ domain-containing protein
MLAPRKGATMEQERRRSPRFPFIASAEVRAENNSSRLAARVSDISAAGCYIDTINPLPHGTLVRVKIFNETQSFEAAATVAYSLAHLGMGLSFSEVPPNSMSVLREWLPAAV